MVTASRLDKAFLSKHTAAEVGWTGPGLPLVWEALVQEHREASRRPLLWVRVLPLLSFFSVLENNFPWAGNYIKIAFSLNKNYA